MKILAFTDLHGSLESLKKVEKKAKNCDLIICTGDFTVFSRHTKKILEQINKLPKKVILIHGNHEDEEQISALCLRLKNIEFIHKKIMEVLVDGKKYTLIGYGGGGFSIRDEHFDKFMSRHTKHENIILLTHAPVYGTKLDMLWEHRGSKSIRDYIRAAKPVLAVCGHFHEHFNEEDKIKDTRIINPGPDGTIIEI